MSDGWDGWDGWVILYCCDTKSIARAMLIIIIKIIWNESSTVKTCFRFLEPVLPNSLLLLSPLGLSLLLSLPGLSVSSFWWKSCSASAQVSSPVCLGLSLCVSFVCVCILFAGAFRGPMDADFLTELEKVPIYYISYWSDSLTYWSTGEDM